MNTRSSDIDLAKNAGNDFVVRKRVPTWQMLVIMFTACAIVSWFLGALVKDSTIFNMLLFSLLAGIGTYVVLLIQNTRDTILATEFQNALFASALGYSNKFCLIIKNDGTITYIDRAFQDMFPSFNRETRRGIDVLLDFGEVPKDQRKTIFAAIEKAVYDKVIFDLKDARGSQHKIVMSIEPIVRPSGFMLLRGREFIEKRTPAQATIDPDGSLKTPLLNKSNATLFSHVMDTMNLGLYMASPTGNVIFSNQQLEQWLKYDDGEISNRNLTIHDLFSSLSDRSIIAKPNEFEGEIFMQRKIGGNVKVFITQKAMHDDAGEVIGYTALIHYLSEQPIAEDKKKTW